MSRDTNVLQFRQPDTIDDPLNELAREGARRMLAQAVIAEADVFVAQLKDLKLPHRRDRVVRHGYGPERTIQTGIGAVAAERCRAAAHRKARPPERRNSRLGSCRTARSRSRQSR
jgi:putative transposase